MRFRRDDWEGRRETVLRREMMKGSEFRFDDNIDVLDDIGIFVERNKNKDVMRL